MLVFKSFVIFYTFTEGGIQLETFVNVIFPRFLHGRHVLLQSGKPGVSGRKHLILNDLRCFSSAWA